MAILSSHTSQTTIPLDMIAKDICKPKKFLTHAQDGYEYARFKLIMQMPVLKNGGRDQQGLSLIKTAFGIPDLHEV